MRKIHIRPVAGILFLSLLTFFAFFGSWQVKKSQEVGKSQAAAPDVKIENGLFEKVKGQEKINVLVKLAVPVEAEGYLTEQEKNNQREKIKNSQARLQDLLKGVKYKLLHEYKFAPIVLIEVNQESLLKLQTLKGDILNIVEDREVKPQIFKPAEVTGAIASWNMGYDGLGRTVAVIDLGFESSNPFLANKIVQEVCFGTCDKGAEGPNVAECTETSCSHGTEVVGVIVGNGFYASDGTFITGVAKGAKVVGIKATWDYCISNPCTYTIYDSYIMNGLEWVYEHRYDYNWAAINISAGSGSYIGYCDEASMYTPIITNLYSVNIPVVASSGNYASGDSSMNPSCVSKAIVVSSVDENDKIPTNVAVNLYHGNMILAPGVNIPTSTVGGGFVAATGTSIATPIVSGAFAILHQAVPTSAIDQKFRALRETGVVVIDDRGLLPMTLNPRYPRIQIDKAIDRLKQIVDGSGPICDTQGNTGTVNNMDCKSQ